MVNMLFIAGPVDATELHEHDWHEEIHLLMAKEEGWITYDAWRAFTVGKGTMPDNKIGHLNHIALLRATALLAYLPDQRTAGVFMEISQAISMEIPVAWFGSDVWESHWSLALKRIQRVPDVPAGLAYCLGAASEQQGRNAQMSELHVQRLSPGAQLPTKSFADDAGYDLYCAESVVIPPGEFRDISIGIAVEPPPGVWYRIVGRSSTFRKRGLLVIEGIIDQGYRGELFVAVTNLGDEDAHVVSGERLAQMIPHKTLLNMQPEWRDQLAPHARGTQGFGSTGR